MSEDKNIVKSVAKAFAVLQSFGPTTGELVLADVARAANIDNATAFRMLNTLTQLGYVERIPSTRRFRLTFKCLDLGFNAIARSDLRDLARPILREIVGPRIEAASIGVMDGHEVVYIERIQAGLERLAVDVRIGNRVPAFSSALGRAILSCLPNERRLDILNAGPPKKLTDHTVVDTGEIMRQIEKAAQDGFALSDQETVTGLRVIAAPIVDVDGFPIAAMSAASSSFGRTTDQFIGDARDLIVESAHRLSMALRASGSVASQFPAA